MKALVGIDTDGAYAPGLHLLKRLEFADANVHLLHACSPSLVYAPYGVPAGLAHADFLDATQKAGQAWLDKARTEAESLGLSVSTDIVLDGPAHALSHLATEEHDDLIVVGAHKRSAAQAMFLGSVSRALAIGARCSILVAKGEPEPKPKLRAIFATDHSNYANRCLQKLLWMRPQGIERIDVVTAYQIDDYESVLLHMELPKLGGMVDEWLEETLCSRGERVAGQLAAAGYQSEVRVRQGKANDVIEEEMAATGSDLLIIGAQGHGFLDRLLIGSVSLHQVVGEPYSVLLLRD